MSGINVDMVGFKELEDALFNLGKKAAGVERKALETAAVPIQKSAVAKAPVRTGKGRDSIKIGKVRTLKGGKIISIGIHGEDHKTGLHMYYQEFGTSRHVAQPFLRPAYEENKSSSKDIIADELKRTLGL